MRNVFVLFAILLAMPGHAAVSEWVPFENLDGLIGIEIKLAGKPAVAIIDSGSQLIGVSESFLEANPDSWRKGRRVTLSGVHGDRTAHLANSLDVELFGAPFELNKVAPMNLGHVDLLIGLQFFADYVIQIDYPNSRLRIIEHKSIKLRESANVRMKRSEGSVFPIVQVDMNGDYEPWLILDTGSTGGVLVSRHRALSAGWLDKFSTTATTSAGVTTTADMESFLLPELTFGPFTLENVLVSVAAEGQSSNIGRLGGVDWSTGTRIKVTEQPEGILGYDVLQHFVLTIDFKRSLLHIGTSVD